jgi:predicted transcriptional regulator
MNFRQELLEDTVGSLPLRDAIIMRPYTVVRAAVARMRDLSIGCVVIVDYDQVPSGIFTEHSVIEVLMKNASLDESPICEFADPNFIVVEQDEPILRVWEAVQLAAARFVCVTDSKGKALGITGQRGLSEYLADCFAGQVSVQRLGSTPWMRQREGA